MKTFCIFNDYGVLIYQREYDKNTTLNTFINDFLSYGDDLQLEVASEYYLLIVSGKGKVEQHKFTYKVTPSFVLLESSK
jgi:hypothetical protein